MDQREPSVREVSERKRPEPLPQDSPRPQHNYPLHIGLFVATFFSVAWMTGGFGALPAGTDPLTPDGAWVSISYGIPFAVLVLLFLTAHEFGHFFAARAHGVDATLPFYIPVPFLLFGTLGAVIRTRSSIPSRKALFDIGVAGPLAGFVVAVAYLIIGMMTMPGIESLYEIHPGYRGLVELPDGGMVFGSFALLEILRELLIEPGRFFPPMNELYHYPFLCAGWFGMFVTALNMLPVGQLDGGHVVYAMFGRRQKVISTWFMRAILFIGLGGVAFLLLDAVRGYDPSPLFRFFQDILIGPMEWIADNAGWWLDGWLGWLLWYGIVRVFIKVEHPPVVDESPIDRRRMAIGWTALVIFALTFSSTGITIPEEPAAPNPPAAGQKPISFQSDHSCASQRTERCLLKSAPGVVSLTYLRYATRQPAEI